MFKKIKETIWAIRNGDKIYRIHDKNVKLINLISSACPLHWVATEDMNGAGAWEIDAYQLIHENDNDD